jgi:hypothetical protein
MNDFVYDSSKCTEVIDIDLPDNVLLQLALLAHERDITLNQLLNEAVHEAIERIQGEEVNLDEGDNT